VPQVVPAFPEGRFPVGKPPPRADLVLGDRIGTVPQVVPAFPEGRFPVGKPPPRADLVLGDRIGTVPQVVPAFPEAEEVPREGTKPHSNRRAPKGLKQVPKNGMGTRKSADRILTRLTASVGQIKGRFTVGPREITRTCQSWALMPHLG
jgi:hypothetical protein